MPPIKPVLYTDTRHKRYIDYRFEYHSFSLCYFEFIPCIHTLPFGYPLPALVKLQDNVRFENQPFDDPDGVAPMLTRLFGEDTTDDTLKLQVKTIVSMNNPWTGHLDGTLEGSSLRMVEPERRGGEDIEWIRYKWTFHGDNGLAAPPPGVSGSAIWDDEGVVIGFFQYYIPDGNLRGFCISVSASHLARFGQGYHLAV
ncbi:uncharacterized protein BP5553_03354 [Venustampulla echinocandica]|uniref:Uncharacterized protein n=1 Tax=Venustampulla echinocandica TaxID=2656787 RepID=A0A370TU21_9HELO|nr:uncharacterized protein BP5553_03354 [Venustampulla echinocandica]RDL39014.1 hypothetical protein BP5553_03354 [Venustampulla echinocandica]